MIKPRYPLVLAPPAVSRLRADRVIAWLRDYSEKRIDSRLFDERRCVPPYVILDFGTQGIFGLQIPEEFGGLALRHDDFLRVLEQLAAIDISLASLVFIHNANGIRPILGFAPPETRERLLRDIAAGRQLASFTLTEPAAGSNLPGLQSRAEPIGDGRWRIHGVKRWNGSGWAGIVTVFARQVDEKGRLRHPAAFVIEQGMAGVRVGRESLTMGVRSIMQNAIVFDGVEVGPERVLGDPGQGMEIADEGLLIARLCMGAISLGGMKRCAQLMLRYASRRQVSTGRLLDTATMRLAFTDLTIKITALEALMQALAAVLDAGEYPADEACMIVKIFGSNAIWEASDTLVETLGGRGYMENNGAAQIMRDCRMLRIGEGANDLMTLSIGRRVLHSEAFLLLLRDTFGAAHLEEDLREVAERIMHRCVGEDAPFADRGTAVAWAHTLIGRVAVRATVLAALEAAQRQSPNVQIERAIAWAAEQLVEERARALDGAIVERLVPGTDALEELVRGYADAIGDLEQAPPGIEDGPDLLLRRDPEDFGFAPYSHLPGDVAQVGVAHGAARADLVRVNERART
jgi:alkylation response protein AidB-like acyl-CoA dehydrogenase